MSATPSHAPRAPNRRKGTPVKRVPRASAPWVGDPDGFADSFRREVQADALKANRVPKQARAERAPKAGAAFDCRNAACGRRVWSRGSRCIRCHTQFHANGAEWAPREGA